MTLPQSPNGRAALWMVGAILSFSAMAVAGRAVSLAHDTFEILLFRSLVGIVIVVALGACFGTLGQINRGRLGLHLVRNLCHFSGQNLWFWALTMIPLAPLFALEFTAPIWVALLSPLVLGERLTRIRVLAVLVGFIGVLIIVRPNPATLNAGALAAAAAAIGFAGSILATRRLTRTDSITCILFWLTVMQAAMGLVCAGFDGAIRLPSPGSLPLLCTIALAGLLAHFCLTQALSLAPASFVMPIDFARLPLIAIIGLALYGEPIDRWIVAGAALIFAANWLNIRGEKPGRFTPAM